MLIHRWLHVLRDIYLTNSLFGAQLLNLRPVGIWGHIIPSCGDYFVHCRMFTSLSGLYSLDNNNNPFLPSSDNQNVSRHYKMFPREQDHFQLKTTDLNFFFNF